MIGRAYTLGARGWTNHSNQVGVRRVDLTVTAILVVTLGVVIAHDGDISSGTSLVVTTPFKSTHSSLGNVAKEASVPTVSLPPQTKSSDSTASTPVAVPPVSSSEPAKEMPVPIVKDNIHLPVATIQDPAPLTSLVTPLNPVPLLQSLVERLPL